MIIQSLQLKDKLDAFRRLRGLLTCDTERVSLDKDLGNINNHKNNFKEVQEAKFGESFERQANLPKFNLEVSERGLYYQIEMECLKHTLYLQTIYQNWQIHLHKHAYPLPFFHICCLTWHTFYLFQ